MTELINILPNIILYIVLGYIFVRIYKFTRIIETNNEYKHVIITSIITGFILYNIFKLVPLHINKYVNVLIMIISTVILSYLLAIFINSKFFVWIRRKLRIKQTADKYIWADIDDKDNGIYVSLFNNADNTCIEGSLILRESFQRQPLIQLAKFRELKNGEVTLDYTEDIERTILVDTSKYDEIYITYDKNSEKIKYWR